MKKENRMTSSLRSVRLAASGVLGVTVVTVGFVILSASRQAQPTSGGSIGPGDEWVPLTVEYIRTIPDGEVQHIKKYRSADGSTRLEQLEIGEIQIANMSKHLFYVYGHSSQRWRQAPLRRQPKDGKPFLQLQRDRVAQVRYDDSRVSAIKDAGLGVSLFELADPGGRRVFCPDLNMLEIFSEKADGIRQQMTKVTLGDPVVEFEPPSNAEIDIVTVPAGPGIVETNQ
jgi:hypothetical protein